MAFGDQRFSLPPLRKHRHRLCALKPYRLTSTFQANFAFDDHGSFWPSDFPSPAKALETRFSRAIAAQQIRCAGPLMTAIPVTRWTISNVNIDWRQASANAKGYVDRQLEGSCRETLPPMWTRPVRFLYRTGCPAPQRLPVRLSCRPTMIGRLKITWRRAIIQEARSRRCERKLAARAMPSR